MKKTILLSALIFCAFTQIFAARPGHHMHHIKARHHHHKRHHHIKNNSTKVKIPAVTNGASAPAPSN